MSDNIRRIEQILERARVAFIRDTKEKIGQIGVCFAEWEAGNSAPAEAAAAVYRHVHGIQGMAKTVSFEEIHRICADIDEYIIQQDERTWTSESLRELRGKTDILARCAEESFGEA